MAIEIVDFPIKNGGSFHSYVSLPEGKKNKKMSKYGSPSWCVLRKEFSGMIHFITFVMSSSQQPPATHPFPAKHHMDLVVTKKK